MPYTYYAHGLTTVHHLFLDRLVEVLKESGAEVVPDDSAGWTLIQIAWRGEYGALEVRRAGPDLQFVYRPDSPGEEKNTGPVVHHLTLALIDIDDELRAMIEGEEEGRLHGGDDAAEEMRRHLQDTGNELLSVRDEVRQLKERGEDVSRPERLLRRAETLYSGAASDLDAGRTPAALGKARAVETLLEKVEAGLGEI
ncbi:hypothetical protein E2N92_12975 [Methanofollis formosanus]|uniref:Uncharacterized protein n=1 Tax=Methanofollis formosanus TaxID=299308 RepID=A0A8G1A4G2_9EURY|nr:hypothetical protein [Methanofollis formosanus]QYZ80276.1 hypothetical protein E2N92_12975 [Methanofollis formosanus]